MPIYLTTTYKDEHDRETKKRYKMTATTLTQAELDAPTAIAALGAVSNSLIWRWSLTEENYVAGPVASPSNIDAGQTIRSQLANRPEKASLKLPDPVAAVIQSGGVIDVDGVLMQAVFALFDVAGTPILTISDGEQLSSFISGILDK